MDRDLNGARGIFLRALVDTPSLKDCLSECIVSVSSQKSIGVQIASSVGSRLVWDCGSRVNSTDILMLLPTRLLNNCTLIGERAIAVPQFPGGEKRSLAQSPENSPIEN
ncbi:MAG: hypothetical protein AB4290_11375 [Spirulina sp.]